MQAIDRTAPILPLMPGAAQRRTHDYRRCGATEVFAALDAATGKVITCAVAPCWVDRRHHTCSDLSRHAMRPPGDHSESYKDGWTTGFMFDCLAKEIRREVRAARDALLAASG